jgi:hypothetical protein
MRTTQLRSAGRSRRRSRTSSSSFCSAETTRSSPGIAGCAADARGGTGFDGRGKRPGCTRCPRTPAASRPPGFTSAPDRKRVRCVRRKDTSRPPRPRADDESPPMPGSSSCEPVGRRSLPKEGDRAGLAMGTPFVAPRFCKSRAAPPARDFPECPILFRWLLRRPGEVYTPADAKRDAGVRNSIHRPGTRTVQDAHDSEFFSSSSSHRASNRVTSS